MSKLSVPSPQLSSVSSPANGTRARSLSNHGMPKEPRNLTVERPHRSPALGFTPTSLHSGPRSPGPFSPPLSAKSFGTFIDSEPSTPAYSPRPNFDWDSSSLVLLKPVGSPLEPSFPYEPTWDIVDPRTKAVSPKQPPFSAKSEFTPRVLSPLSIRSTRSSRSHAAHKEIKIVDLSEKLHEIQLEEELKEDKENELEEEQSANSSSAPLGRLASKMKLMLSRKSTGEKKKKSKKDKNHYDVEYLDDKHWTEM